MTTRPAGPAGNSDPERRGDHGAQRELGLARREHLDLTEASTAATWPPCASTPEYRAWADEQLAAAPQLTDAQRAAIVAAVAHDPTERRAS